MPFLERLDFETTFDLVIELLTESNPQYSFYRTEFYKERSNKMFRFLNVIISSASGKNKLRTWFRQPVTVELFCDVVTEEMNAVLKAELLPGIAAITPEFIRNWTVSSYQETAPSLLRILLSAAQTSTAKEKKIRKRNQTWYVIILVQSFFLSHLEQLCDILLRQLSTSARKTPSAFQPSSAFFYGLLDPHGKQLTLYINAACRLAIPRF